MFLNKRYKKRNSLFLALPYLANQKFKTHLRINFSKETNHLKI